MTNPKDCPVSDAMIRAGRVAAMAHRLGGPNDDAMTAIYLAMHRASPGGDEVVERDVAVRLGAAIPDVRPSIEVVQEDDRLRISITVKDDDAARLHVTAEAVEAAVKQRPSTTLLGRRVVRDANGPWVAVMDFRTKLAALVSVGIQDERYD
jgi:hypothetical protein